MEWKMAVVTESVRAGAGGYLSLPGADALIHKEEGMSPYLG